MDWRLIKHKDKFVNNEAENMPKWYYRHELPRYLQN
jgi:hypothetical protein